MKSFEEISNAIENERLYQESKWKDSDDQNNEFNWAAYIGAYTNRSLIGFPGNNPERVENFKRDMIKVAALAVAAIQKLDSA